VIPLSREEIPQESIRRRDNVDILPAVTDGDSLSSGGTRSPSLYLGGFQLIFSELARSDGTEQEEVLMLDATYLKANRMASSLKKGQGVRNLD